MSKDNTKERTVTDSHQGPMLPIYGALDNAGIEGGDSVTVSWGNGYVIVTPSEADVPISEVPVEDRPNVSDSPIESPFEARVVGNRLFEIGEKYDQIDKGHVAAETQELARRFHKYANNNE